MVWMCPFLQNSAQWSTDAHSTLSVESSISETAPVELSWQAREGVSGGDGRESVASEWAGKWA